MALLDAYLERHPDISAPQKTVVLFHSAQFQADAGDTAGALKKFRRTYNEELDRGQRWNYGRPLFSLL